MIATSSRFVIVATAFGGCASALVDSEYIRKQRLQYQFRKRMTPFELKRHELFVSKLLLASDIEESINSQSCGVKIIWAPQGSGKTTTVRRVLRQLQNEDKISGALIACPPSNETKDDPSVWFRYAISDIFGVTLKPMDKLSNFLTAPKEKPFVVVLDQCEDIDFLDKMRVFIKSMAADSALTKSYVVLVICADPVKASIMWDWNGRQKIAPIGTDEPLNYRWREYEIDLWIDFHRKHNPGTFLEDDHLRDYFRKAAVTAGTPGFLVSSAQSGNYKNSDSKKERWDRSASFFNKQWKDGAENITWNNEL